jgi:hypothetical protein
MNKFTPYRIPKYNENKYIGKYAYQANSMSNGYKYSELCKKCGHTMGDHNFLDDCLPSSDKPIFYIEEINKNITIL